jgi:hypothetical protein
MSYYNCNQVHRNFLLMSGISMTAVKAIASRFEKRAHATKQATKVLGIPQETSYLYMIDTKP